MYKPKPRRSEILVADQLALAKSAAWAWYERGSGSDGRSLREVDVWRAKVDPRPSRYKLEASRNVQHRQSRRNSLLDVYEIERISRQLNRYIESSRAKYNDVPLGQAETKIKSSDKKKVGKRFWMRRGPVCGSSSDDVAETVRRPTKGRAAGVEVGASVLNRGRWR